MTEELMQFFGGYFHQDWDLMADDWQGIIDNCTKDAVKAGRNQLRLLAEGIEDFRLSHSEAELDTALRDASSYYRPLPPETYKEWLGEVAERLRHHGTAIENGTT